jgi:hypothetical protein
VKAAPEAAPAAHMQQDATSLILRSLDIHGEKILANRAASWRARNRIFRDAPLRKNSIPYPNFLTEPIGGGLGAPMLRKSLMQLSEHEAQLLSGPDCPRVVNADTRRPGDARLSRRPFWLLEPQSRRGRRFAPVERPINPERRGDAAWPAGALDAADKDSSGIADFTSYDVEHPV